MRAVLARNAEHSALLIGAVSIGPGARLAQGAIARAQGPLTIGAGTMILENSVVIASRAVSIGRRSVFGHRCVVLDATVGDLNEIGNGSLILTGATLGDRCFLGEGTLIAPGQEIPDDSVVVGRPGRIIRRANRADIDRLTSLRGGDLAVPVATHDVVVGRPYHGASMGTLYEYRGIVPRVDPTATVMASAEITGDVTIGAGSIIGAGVRIIGDSHGPVRIGARVQILENSVLHLLPDNELVIEDDVVIGPACMIHGCTIGEGTVIEPGANVCDGAQVGARSEIGAGSLVPQRARVPSGTRFEGFPARHVRDLTTTTKPAWAYDHAAIQTRIEAHQ